MEKEDIIILRDPPAVCGARREIAATEAKAEALVASEGYVKVAETTFYSGFDVVLRLPSGEIVHEWEWSCQWALHDPYVVIVTTPKVKVWDLSKRGGLSHQLARMLAGSRGADTPRALQNVAEYASEYGAFKALRDWKQVVKAAQAALGPLPQMAAIDAAVRRALKPLVEKAREKARLGRAVREEREAYEAVVNRRLGDLDAWREFVAPTPSPTRARVWHF